MNENFEPKMILDESLKHETDKSDKVYDSLINRIVSLFNGCTKEHVQMILSDVKQKLEEKIVVIL